MTSVRTYFSNAAETTLSALAGVGATTLSVVSSTGFPAVPFYAVVEPASNTKREIVLVTAKTATTFTATRGQDGTSDVQHDSGVSIKVVPVAAMFTDLHDRIDATDTTVATKYAPGGTDVALADGGTGASTAAGARTNLGLGTIATQNANGVAITGGTVTGITDLAVADGGTGASDAAGARTNLGLVIGTNVQAYDAELAALAGLTSAANKIPRFTGSGTAGLIDFLDEDAMTSDSATAVPSQQSVKAYVDTNGAKTTTVVKTADESVTSSTTLQSDDVLLLPVTAGTSYAFEGFLYATGPSAGDFKLAFTFPTGATFVAFVHHIGANGAVDSFKSGTNPLTTSGGSLSLATGAADGVAIKGGIIVAGTAGNVQLQWAQDASSATPTIVKAGSWLRLTKV